MLGFVFFFEIRLKKENETARLVWVRSLKKFCAWYRDFASDGDVWLQLKSASRFFFRMQLHDPTHHAKRPGRYTVCRENQKILIEDSEKEWRFSRACVKLKKRKIQGGAGLLICIQNEPNRKRTMKSLLMDNIIIKRNILCE